MSSHRHSHFPSLTEFIHGAELAFLTGDDAVFEAAMAKDVAPEAQGENIATREHLNHAAFRKMVLTLRSDFTNRVIVSESFVVATPRDPTEKTGAVGFTHVFTGVKAGANVSVTVAAVLRVNWVEDRAHPHGGHRQIVAEAFVMNMS